ncbi:MAG TPA: glycosyltransferase family 9 protein, partial [Candidatus Eisenbacteria bacterium]|nr:glycosyltransferase family 9 protein [Candidatus Eisenbacteria bacterium]
VSGSSAALGSFIVGFSGARFRAGIEGRWDRWFNIRLSRPSAVNKYAALHDELLAPLGLRSAKRFPAIMLTPAEIAEGSERIAAMLPDGHGPIVGIFVGGRKSRGKRWPSANFVELATGLRAHHARPIVFVGPEEMDLLSDLRFALADRVPLVFEPDIRKFASAVASCDLFVACDSGPVHLACALRVRTVAVFLKNNFDRWGPPPELASIVYRDAGVKVVDVLEACRAQLNGLWPQPLVEKIANRSCQGIGTMKTCRRAWLRHRLPRRRLEQIAD